MHKQVGAFIAALFYYSGLIKLVRLRQQRAGRSLAILYYHRAEGKNLRRQWLYLRRRYRILPLTVALAELEVSHGEAAQKRDRRPPLAITFDDGYQDNYTHAFALASELQMPFTIFLISEYIECACAFWWADRLIHLAQVDQVSFAGQTYALDRLEERKTLALAIDQCVSTITSEREREQLLHSLSDILQVPLAAISKEEPVALLTWAQIQEMQASELVSFGCHTHHHPDLARLASPAEVLSEVRECRITLERRLQCPLETFAYPYGHVGEHGLSSVKQVGYTWAVTTRPGLNTFQSNPHLLCRTSVDAHMHVYEVAALLTGMWAFLVWVKRGIKLLTRSFWRVISVSE